MTNDSTILLSLHYLIKVACLQLFNYVFELVSHWYNLNKSAIINIIKLANAMIAPGTTKNMPKNTPTFGPQSWSSQSFGSGGSMMRTPGTRKPTATPAKIAPAIRGGL